MPTIIEQGAIIGVVILYPYPRLRLVGNFLLWSVFVSTLTLLKGFLILRPVFHFLKIDLTSKSISAFIIISTFAPRVGRYIGTRNVEFERPRSWYDQRIGDEMVDFRDRLRFVFSRNRKFNEVPDWDEMLADIARTQREIRRRHTYGEILIAAGGTLLAIIVGQVSFLGGIAIAISVYLVFFPLSMFLRDIVVDTLAYSAEIVDRQGERTLNRPFTRKLIFMREWNKLLLRRESIIHRFILVGLLRGEFVNDVDRGIELMESVVYGEKDIDDALDDLVEEQLGGNNIESKLMRRVLKFYIGS